MSIQNERQRQITQDWLKDLQGALEFMNSSGSDATIIQRAVSKEVVQSQIEVLRSDLLAYDNDQEQRRSAGDL